MFLFMTRMCNQLQSRADYISQLNLTLASKLMTQKFLLLNKNINFKKLNQETKNILTFQLSSSLKNTEIF